jgi:hypothetical protein
MDSGYSCGHYIQLTEFNNIEIDNTIFGTFLEFQLRVRDRKIVYAHPIIFNI